MLSPSEREHVGDSREHAYPLLRESMAPIARHPLLAQRYEAFGAGGFCRLPPRRGRRTEIVGFCVAPSRIRC